MYVCGAGFELYDYCLVCEWFYAIIIVVAYRAYVCAIFYYPGAGTLGVYINSTVPVGTLATYGFTALILEMTGNWKMVFFGAFVVVMLTAAGWWISTGILLPKLTRVDTDNTAQAANADKTVKKMPLGEVVLSSGMVFMCLVL